MSGHNPHHGRLGQPNNSWNHLQVPSYIPRQPQMAHVHMNDALPLNWQPDAALYNYALAAATQHKTQLELNPLLPAFARPPVVNSFGSVDLSFPSHARHNLTPSPHNVNNTSMPNSVTPPPPSEFSSPLQFPLKPMHSPGTVATPPSIKDVTSNIVNGDKVSNNVSQNEKLVDDSVTPSNLATGLFVAHQLNSDPTKNNAWVPPAAHPEPMELIKETVKIIKNALMNEIIERTSTQDQTPSLPNHSPSTSLTDLSNSTRHNNISTQPLTESSSPFHGNTSNSHNTSRDSLATTSNDESLDSSGGKKRRRRKPNKTCRLSNNEIDEDILSNNNKHLESAATNPFVDSNDERLKTMNETSELKNIPVLENDNNSIQTTNTSMDSMNMSHSDAVEPQPQSIVLADKSGNVENGIIGDIDKSINTNNQLEPYSSPVTRHRRSASRITSPNQLNQDQSSNCSSTSIQRRPGKRKLDTDDCETIDKIAAMIASSSPEFNPENGRSTPMPTNENLPLTENGNLKEILETADDIVDQKDNRFEDVEIKLKEMFAGIEDDTDQKAKEVKLTGCREVRVAIKTLPSIDEVAAKSVIKKNGKDAANKSLPSSTDETDHKVKKIVKRLPKTKMKKGVNKKTNKIVKANNNSISDNKKVKIKEEAPADTTSKFKGPFIHVKSDGSSNVVNNLLLIAEDVAVQKSKIKKVNISQTQTDLNKIRGLHVSTLSMKYDAATTDKTWMCVFCKMGPHKFGLGDLFGPYILSTTSEDFALSEIDPSEDVFKSKRTKADMIQRRSLPMTSGGIAATGNPKRKRKPIEPIPSTSANTSINNSSCASDTADIFDGMTKASDTSYEVWVHGDCAVWASGVHLIGTRIVGLDAAVWGSTRHQCTKCQNYGAMLCCLKRGCNDSAHMPCARKSNWSLSDEDFKVMCDKHCEKVDTTVSNVAKST